jgi:hypothetical protein
VAEPAPQTALTDFEREVLVALVEGYRAREGMKDRIRALNEWEIARRSGATMLSYAEFANDPSREALISVLGHLERLGLVSTWERGANYDTFVPTTRGNIAVDGRDDPASAFVPTDRESSSTESAPDAVTDRLDEIIRLLRSIEGRMPGSR